ncbi:unnamed protein product [Prorocentrum cordatum]|uniref:phosphatidylserine decarboxylase n=1 Tax=Prorocentrum cordatum TaxID=2364126 RepID=A0ABN9VNL3_9DINO|nr:unnamed protein product [Polarella glacialis]
MPAPIADESEGMADSFGVVLILTAALVCTFACTMQHKFQECVEIVGNPAQITSPGTLFWLRILSGRMRSRWFGALTEVWLPVGLRAPLFRLFAWTYGVHLEEVKHPLDSFRTLNDFFCRVLKDGARPISDIPAGLVSPVDGRVLAAGVIEHADARVEQVKGATYSVPAFLGLDPFECKAEKSVLRYVVLYLAPGDYHRIHAPCRATFSQGRHFCGELFPLKQCILKNVNDIFAVNERVVLSGEWAFGQMHLVAVGAMNVGNIYLGSSDFDEKLKTNRLRDIAVHCGGDVSQKLYEGVAFEPGGNVGGFRLGSTVVLVFDAPECFQLKVNLGDSVRVGEPLGEVTQ